MKKLRSLTFVFTSVVIFGAILYSCENEENFSDAEIESETLNLMDKTGSDSSKCAEGAICPDGDGDGDGGGGGVGNIPTFDEGYDDGFEEGQQLSIINNFHLYNDLWKSYQAYPSNFPNLTQYHPYFNGKYLGIVDGWLAYRPQPQPCTINCLHLPEPIMDEN